MGRGVLGVLAFLLACSISGPAFAQEVLIDIGSKGARVARAAQGERLAPPATTRADAVRSFLRGRFDEATLAELVQTRDHTFGGVGHADFGQRVAGMDVYGTYVRSSFAASGDLVSVIENLVPVTRALRPAQIGPEAALRSVMARYYPGAAADLRETSTVGNVSTFERRGPFAEPPTVTRVALPLAGAVLDSGFLVVTWDTSNILRHTAVTGRGQIVYEELRTNTDGYRIYPIDPGKGGQVLVNDPSDPTASPNGWVSTNTTIGNNVDAYLDRDNNNAADSGGRPTATNGVFDFAFNTSIAPTDANNQRAAVTNLFYLNNLLHDRLYGYGFTESAGNFQADNFGRGGSGNDPVNAEAQDGGGTNNANFATPADGSRPRMQMYLWTAPNPDRDGDLDSDIVYHEYGHGLTWRMIGGMSGPMSGAIGEGMSDVLALYFNGDDRVGEYSTANPIGIRSAPYTNYSRTYGDFSGTGVHFNGEIYAATMWRLRQLWLAESWDPEILHTYVVNGMNHTPSGPAFEDMRDGILTSVNTLDTGLNTTAASCVVWEAFAQFGVGVGADGRVSCRGPFGNNCSISITESFAVPSTCTGSGGNTAPSVSITSPAASGGSVTVTQGQAVSFAGSASDEEDGNLSNSLLWTSNIGGNIGSGASFSTSSLATGTHTVTASVTDTGGLTGSATVTVVVNAVSGSDITLTASGSKVKGVRIANLSWSGSGGSVDVFRDGSKVATVGGTAYTDTIPGKGGGSFVYRVCNAGTTTCSNSVTVTF